MTKQNYINLVKEGKKLVKDFNITVAKKAFHKGVLYDVKNLYTKLLPINPFLFDASLEYYWSEYKTSVELNKTKKELDHKLKRCIDYLNNQLNSILSVSYNNEIKFDEE